MTGDSYPQNRWDLVPDPVDVPTVSVVIPFYRQQADLDRLLVALSCQAGWARIVDVTVVDDGSDPPLELEATVGNRRVTVLHQEDRGCRPAAARNLGVRHSRGDVLVFFDADTLPGPETVAQLARLPAVAPDSVVVGRRYHVDLDGWTGSDVVAWLTDPSFSSDCAPHPPPLGPRSFHDPAWLQEGYQRSRDLLDVDDRSYQWIIGAVMATSRRFFDELGGFDATIDTYGGEDWDIAYRAYAAGALLRHEPRAVAFHNGPSWAELHEWQGLKNPERLAVRRNIPGAADPIRGPFVQHLVTLEVSGWSTDEVVATTASILRDISAASVAVAIPAATPPVGAVMQADGRVVIGEHDDEVRRRALTETVVHVPVRPDTMSRVVSLVAPGGPGLVHIEHDQRLVASVTSLRALARVHRWRQPGRAGEEADDIERLFGRSTVTATTAGLQLIDRPVDLEAIFRR